MDLYRHDLDAGVHGATRWVLQRWGETESLRRVDETLASDGPIDGRRWYIDRQGITFTIMSHPVSSLSPKENQPMNPDAELAMATTELMVSQFQTFKRDHQYDKRIAPTPDCPVNRVSWYDAAEYCNWLSQRDGIPEAHWCYRRNEKGLLDFVPDYRRRRGYRLPTEAEWELACRAGADTLWCCGDVDEELIGKYAWWLGNSHVKGVQRSFPVASLKPNAFGIFDMHGNIAEWCQELTSSQSVALYDDISCGGRGGIYSSAYRNVAADYSFAVGRKTALAHVGFRICRTIW